LALLLMGALGEGCLYIAESNDPDEARTEVLALITDMLSAFRIEQKPSTTREGSPAAAAAQE
jgi:hypothetical protein